MIRIRDLSLPPSAAEADLRRSAARALGVPEEQLTSIKLHRRSVDARKKPILRLICTVDVTLSTDEAKAVSRCRSDKITIVTDTPYEPVPLPRPADFRPVIVGFGPAGMFCALVLAQCGLRPVILERGEDVDSRTAKVEAFWSGGTPDPDSNVQFGEGGAGTFSDGKLNTGVNDPRIAWILRQFVRFGADPDIEYDARPHIGTDVLKTVVKNLRLHLQGLGASVRFSTQMTDLLLEKDRLRAVVTNHGDTVACDALVLAVGHSARDTFELLERRGVPMQPKAFSMGVRIEHRQSLIDRAQYGAPHEAIPLPAADYRLNAHFPEGDSAYTFCMCPGGYVVASASEPGGVVTNGMSCRARDGENANSALLVTLRPEDFPDPSPLGGMRWQRELEQRAFAAGGGSYRAPAQTVGSFLGQGDVAPTVTPTYRPGVTWCDLHTVLPPVITRTLEKAIPALDHRLHGFADGGAVLTAPETRSSSPVRILRNDDLQSSLCGLYPCGEGAGYAGGITSAALDGIRVAEAILQTLR